MLVTPSARYGAPTPLGEATALPLQPVLVHREGDPGRTEVEGFIRRVYAERYGADLQSFAPMLVSLREEDRIVAAAGYRSARQGPLFLERYLGAPVESLLAAKANSSPTRDDIVEVGHLAAVRAGEGRRLIRLLAKGEYFFGGLDDWLEKHLHRDGTCGIQCPGNFPGMGGYLFESFRPVKMLAAGDKPDFVLFEIDVHNC